MIIYKNAGMWDSMILDLYFFALFGFFEKCFICASFASLNYQTCQCLTRFVQRNTKKHTLCVCKYWI